MSITFENSTARNTVIKLVSITTIILLSEIYIGIAIAWQRFWYRPIYDVCYNRLISFIFFIIIQNPINAGVI
jgi:hypothetical protein